MLSQSDLDRDRYSLPVRNTVVVVVVAVVVVAAAVVTAAV